MAHAYVNRIVTFFLLLSVCRAQSTTGSVGGRLLDSSGAAMSRITVKLRNIATGEVRSAGQLYGSTGRNLLLGPDAVNWDISAFKIFPVTEHQAVQFRADIFNVFNEVNFSNPNTTLSSGNFGKITAASSPRIFQFALKYVF